ncbi:MAG: GNAT family N-acetyltransferase [Actinomycetota bacterium]
MLEWVVDLRTAQAGDAEAVAAIYIDSWNRGFGHLLGMRQHATEQVHRWRSTLADPITTWTVAEDRGHVVGFIGIGASRDPVDPVLGEVDTIAVDPCCWRRGVGRALMHRGLEQLHASWRRGILWTPADYPSGHRFYEAMGWRRLNTTRNSGAHVAFGHQLLGRSSVARA